MAVNRHFASSNSTKQYQATIKVFSINENVNEIRVGCCPLPKLYKYRTNCIKIGNQQWKIG